MNAFNNNFDSQKHKELFFKQHIFYAKNYTNSELNVDNLQTTLEQVWSSTIKLYQENSLQLLNHYVDSELKTYMFGFSNLEQTEFHIRHLIFSDENDITMDKIIQELLPSTKIITCRSRKAIQKYDEILLNLGFSKSQDVIFPDGYNKEIHQGYIKMY